jgi:hypothetical protein
MFLRNEDIYVQAHTALLPRGQTSVSTSSSSQKPNSWSCKWANLIVVIPKAVYVRFVLIISLLPGLRLRIISLLTFLCSPFPLFLSRLVRRSCLAQIGAVAAFGPRYPMVGGSAVVRRSILEPADCLQCPSDCRILDVQLVHACRFIPKCGLSGRHQRRP